MANNIERDVYTKADGIKIPIDYVQNTNAIPIIFHFRDFQIPAGATAQVFVQKPSGLAVYNSATISGNDVTVDVTTQMMAEVGFNKLQIQVMSGEDNLVTFVQPVNVRQNYTDGESEESKNESNLFDELQEAAQAANTAAESANSAAEEIEAKAEAGDFSSTVTVGSTTTGEPGSQASVTNSGTAQNPVLDFVIPTGAQGPQGPKGDPGSAEDIDTTPVTFEQASTRDNVASGDTVSTLFGKISKWFSDLGTAAFKGVSNVLTQTSDGYVLDARQGNVLSTMIGVLDNLATTAKTNLVAAINECAMEIGNLTALTTDEKTDLVSAINETNAGLTELNSKLQDTGWVDCSLGNGMSVAGGRTPQVRRIGNIVYMRGRVTTSTQWTQHDSIVRIPDGFRPSQDEAFIQTSTGTYRYRLEVKPAGNVVANAITNNENGNATTLNGQWFALSCSWLADG